MEMNITTPGLLFPAISLLLLAYTNRFVTLTSVIRQLSKPDDKSGEDLARRQISSLRKRIQIIRWMQVFGVTAFLFCTMSTFALFVHLLTIGKILFGVSLIFLSVSLVFSLWEVQISAEAINIEVERLDR